MPTVLAKYAPDVLLKILQASDGPWWLRTSPTLGGNLGPQFFLRVATDNNTGVTSEILYRHKDVGVPNYPEDFLWKVGAEHSLEWIDREDEWKPTDYCEVGTRRLGKPGPLLLDPTSYSFFRLFGLSAGSSQRAVNSEYGKYTRILDPVTQTATLTVVPMFFTPNTTLPVWRKETWTQG